jgi:cold shock protein
MEHERRRVARAAYPPPKQKDTAMPLKGRVKWFNEQKGYGFIEVAEGRDVFVHYAALQRPEAAPVRAGQFVEFDPAARNPLADEEGKAR